MRNRVFVVPNRCGMSAAERGYLGRFALTRAREGLGTASLRASAIIEIERGGAGAQPGSVAEEGGDLSRTRHALTGPWSSSRDGIVVSRRPRTQHERSLTAGIPVCLSETLPPDRPPLLIAPAPCTMRRRMRSGGRGRTAVRRMRLDQGPLHSPEDAE